MQRIDAFLEEREQQRVIEVPNAPTLYLYDIINGKPVYKASDNLGAAVNINTDPLITGAAGLQLNGDGLRLLIWEEPGGPRDKHVEFEDRLLPGGDFESGAPVNHSTHVTGTIIGVGINPEARGMAPKAGAVVYNFENDDAEIAQELSDNRETMILSNHSYGVPAGWRRDGNSWSWFGDEEIDENEDWKFGFYSSGARNWDQFIYDAPYYLMVKSAGNSRSGVGDGTKPPNGPYDQIVFQSAAKNIVTVGATRKFSGTYNDPSQVQMSSFSSWGPTDDGRIKPDISAPGVSIISSGAGADDAYISLQGTSMSSPVVMGSLALIQEMNKKQTGRFMKAATIKALLLHTAHEAGAADGPDYEFGWGFINTQGMADFLLRQNDDNIALVVDSIAEGETDAYAIQPKAGTKVKITMVWTDVPGTPVAPQLDPEDLMLVNDLDMRVTREGEEHLPWILDPAVPNAAATKGDNFRDNVEKIEFEATGEAYTLSVGHKNSITNDVQEYTLIIEYEKENATQTYYWIGGSGNWEEANNWSLRSGGAAAGAVPTSSDQVVFDRNSFSALAEGESFVINVNADVAISKINWFGDRQGNLVLNGNEIEVRGDVYLADQNLSLSGGTLSLNPSTNEIRFLASADLSASTLILNNPAAAVVATGKLTVADLVVEAGEFNYSGDTLLVENFITRTSGTKTITLSDAIVQVNNSMDWINGTNVNFAGTQFYVAADKVVNATLGNVDLNATFFVEGSVSFDQAPSIKNLSVIGDVTFNSTALTDSLSLSPGASFNLSTNTNFQVLEGFDASGSDGSLVQLVGVGSNEFSILGNQKICEDYLSVSDLDYVGEATLAIGKNSVVTNGTGWLEQTCEETLFADYSFQYGCAVGVTFFENLSSGPVTASNWSVNGDAVQNDGTGALAGLIVPFESAGNYNVTLEAEGATAAASYTKAVEIVENTINTFSITQEKGILVSLKMGERYQWFKDGVAIPGETTRQYETEEDGVYQVLVFEGSCNRLSNEFELRVTSIENEVQMPGEASILLFPNPTSDQVSLSIENLPLRSLNIEIVDASGKQYFAQEFEELSDDEFYFKINFGEKARGLYILRLVINEKDLVTKKLLIR